jgi:osmotically-inducible protein OsmY
MRTDSEIEKDVEEELRWDPDIDAADVAVAVHDGVVALTGYVRSYKQRTQAERDVKRVAGTSGVANDIEVRLPFVNKRPDPEIARNAVEKLHDELPYSAEFLKITVQDGWLTLDGELEWNYQRDRAMEAVRTVRGVIGISDEIKFMPRVSASDVERRIEDALKRPAERDSNRIAPETNGSEVKLTGRVKSWAERTEAEQTA